MIRLPRRIVPAALVAALGLCAPPSYLEAADATPRIEAIRFWSFGDLTRVAIETSGGYNFGFDHLDSPPRLFFDLKGLRPPAARSKGVQVFRVGDRIIRQIRVAETGPGVSRVVFDLEVPAEFTSSQLINPDRLMIEVRPKRSVEADSLTTRSRTGVRRASDAAIIAGAALEDTTPAPAMPPIPHANAFVRIPFRPPQLEDDGPPPKSTLVWNGEAVKRTAPATRTAVKTEPKIDPAPSKTESLNAAVEATATHAEKVITKPQKPPSRTPEAVAPAKTDRGNQSLVRVFGLKIHKVVIDAGHGGHDTGTIGPKGLMEKDLVLDVALRLGKLIENRLDAEVVYTRSNDTFIALEQRTKLANDEKADLFVSIHANSSPASSATGVETYYFNFTNDRTALDLATRENASANSSIFELNDLLHKAVLNAKVEESRQFAQKVQVSLHSMSVRMNSASRDRGVKKAPFVVLIGATMPSILAEVGFVSNPRDEKLLRKEEQRRRIADSLYKGIAAYASSLSHMQMARLEQDEQ